MNSHAVSIELDLISEATGSARLNVGKFSVLACVFGPAQPKYSRLESSQAATIEVELTLCAGSEQGIEKSSSSYIKESLERCVDLSAFPRMVFVLQVHVLGASDCGLGVAINASTLAFINAGIAMHSTPVAVCLGFYFGEWLDVVESRTDEKPTSSDASIVLVFAAFGQNEIGGTNALSVLSSSIQGPVRAAEVPRLVDMALLSANTFLQIMRQAIAPAGL